MIAPAGGGDWNQNANHQHSRVTHDLLEVECDTMAGQIRREQLAIHAGAEAFEPVAFFQLAETGLDDRRAPSVFRVP